MSTAASRKRSAIPKKHFKPGQFVIGSVSLQTIPVLTATTATRRHSSTANLLGKRNPPVACPVSWRYARGHPQPTVGKHDPESVSDIRRQRLSITRSRIASTMTAGTAFPSILKVGTGRAFNPPAGTTSYVAFALPH